MGERNPIIRLLITGCLLLTCSRDLSNPYEDSFVGDYDLQLVLPQDGFEAFIPYRIGINQGEDKYVSFSAFTEPGGLIDTFCFRRSAQDTLEFYFVNKFTGSLCIKGKRHNGREDIYLFPVDVSSPLSITGPETLLVDTHTELILTPDSPEKSSPGSVKATAWYCGSTAISDSVSPLNRVSWAAPSSGHFLITVQVEDFRGHRFIADSLWIFSPGRAPLVSEVKKPLFLSAGRPFEIAPYLRSYPGDSGRVEIFWGGDTVRVPVGFRSDSCLWVPVRCPGIPSGPDSVHFGCRYVSFSGPVTSPITSFSLPLISSIYRTRIISPSMFLIAGDTLSLGVKTETHDGHQVSGGICSWRILLGADTLLSRNGMDLSTVEIRPDSPGDLQLYVTYTAIDGLKSQPCVARFCVIDSLPPNLRIYSLPREIFCKIPVTLVASVPGDSGDFVGRSFWSFDGDTLWEDTVQGYAVQHSFQGTGDIAVVCKTISAQQVRLYQEVFTILEDQPQIESVSFDPQVGLGKGRAYFRIMARSPLGLDLDSFEILLSNDEKTIRFGSRYPEFWLPLDDSECGVWIVKARARQVNRSWSALFVAEERLHVTRGVPVVSAASSFEAVMGKTATFRFHLYDPDGTVSSLLVNWGDSKNDTVPVGVGTASLDVTHTYESIPPTRVFSLVAVGIDDRRESSAPCSAAVTVVSPAPEVSLRESSFIFGNDTMHTFVSGDTLLCPYITEHISSGIGSEVWVKNWISLSGNDKDGHVLFYSASFRNEGASMEGLQWQPVNSFFLDSVNPYYNLSFHPDSAPVRIGIFCKDDEGNVSATQAYIRTIGPPTPVLIESPANLDTVRTPSTTTISYRGGHCARHNCYPHVKCHLYYLSGGTMVNAFSQPVSATPASDGSIYFTVSIPATVPNGYTRIEVEVIDPFGNSTSATREVILFR